MKKMPDPDIFPNKKRTFSLERFPKKQCTWCKETFTKSSSVSVKEWNEQTKFCSRACYWAAKKKVFTCVICSKEFNRASYGSWKPQVCSRTCHNKLHSKIMKHPRKPCKVCGEPVKRAAAIYCSVKCRNAGYRGENVYNYMGEEFRKDAYPVGYVFWQNLAQEIRERDKACQHCGKTPHDNGRALDVHHLIPYRISQNNSPDNLITLCRVCHKKADHDYKP